jgi:hypothetical protein
MPDTLPDAPIVIVFRVVTPDTAPLLIITPLIVFVVVGAVIAPKLTLPVVMIALPVPAPGPTVSVSVFPADGLDTVNVLPPLLIDGAVIAPHPSVPMLDTLQPDNTIVLSRVAPVI